MTFTVLKSTGQILCKMSLSQGVSDVFSHNETGVLFEEEEYSFDTSTVR